MDSLCRNKLISLPEVLPYKHLAADNFYSLCLVTEVVTLVIDLGLVLKEC